MTSFLRTYRKWEWALIYIQSLDGCEASLFWIVRTVLTCSNQSFAGGSVPHTQWPRKDSFDRYLFRWRIRMPIRLRFRQFPITCFRSISKWALCSLLAVAMVFTLSNTQQFSFCSTLVVVNNLCFKSSIIAPSNLLTAPCTRFRFLLDRSFLFYNLSILVYVWHDFCDNWRWWVYDCFYDIPLI